MASKGHVLGHEDVMNDRNYTTSVKCQSHEGTVFAMRSDEFLANMAKNERAWSCLHAMSDERDKITKGKLKFAQRNQNEWCKERSNL